MTLLDFRSRSYCLFTYYKNVIVFQKAISIGNILSMSFCKQRNDKTKILQFNLIFLLSCYQSICICQVYLAELRTFEIFGSLEKKIGMRVTCIAIRSDTILSLTVNGNVISYMYLVSVSMKYVYIISINICQNFSFNSSA